MTEHPLHAGGPEGAPDGAGFAVIGYVLYNADIAAKIGGLCWLAVGLIILLVRKATHRSLALAQPE